MRFIIALVLGLMLSSVSYAAEGGNLTGGCNAGAGDLICEAFYLCDGRGSADTFCAEFNLNDATRGFPTYFKINIEKLTGCGSPTLVQVLPRGTNVTGSCGASPATGCVDLRGSPLTTAAIQGDTFDTDYQYVDASLGGTLTSCTDIEVSIVLWWRRP